MISNVRGRVNNTPLPKSQALLPLLEAIINSIDAIEDIHDDISNGLIKIRVIRQPILPINEDGGSEPQSLTQIDGFEITDNGIGFTSINFDAFNEADTQYKERRGGKGVGRFLWLKAFQRVEVESVFSEGNDTFQRRFAFTLGSTDGIANHTIIQVDHNESNKTVVRLLNMKPEYQNAISRSPTVIAQRIVEHCLEYFVWNRMPKISLVDKEIGEIDLDYVYNNLVESTQRSLVSVNNVDFEITHFMLHHQPELEHSINYCANQRLVITKRLSGKIANLPAKLFFTNKDGFFVYTGYVSSDYLDRRVNQQRTGFETLPEEGFQIPGEPAWENIEIAILNTIREFLKPFTETVRIEKEERIREYITENAPQYRYIAKNYPEQLDTIAPDVSDDKLDAQLYEISKTIEATLRTKAEHLLEGVDPSADYQALDEQLEELSQWWEEYNEVGKSSLAKYIVHRKRILTILEKVLNIQATGKYSREEVIHRIIFPLRKSSEDITYDQHNLWVLDEKLSYHEYLASDIPLSKIVKLENDSASRPDLIFFFDRAIAMVDDEAPFNSGIVIFEFKRPMRNDYTDNENPILQVLQYVQEIKDGNARTKNGRPIQVPPRTPFYCYVVCDLTKELQKQARFANLRSTPDNLGYFGYNEEIGAYIEVFGFEKLLGDANKRNRILFDKLNLPAKLRSEFNE